MDAEPVVATPIPTFVSPEHVVEPVVKEDTPTVDDVTPDEEQPAVGESEGPVPEPQKETEEPAPVVAVLVERPGTPPEVVEQEDPVPPVAPQEPEDVPSGHPL